MIYIQDGDAYLAQRGKRGWRCSRGRSYSSTRIRSTFNFIERGILYRTAPERACRGRIVERIEIDSLPAIYSLSTASTPVPLE
jgi:hypothetical protein